MEIESIRGRKPRLDSLTSTIRLPPLIPEGVPSDRTSAKLYHGSLRVYGVDDRYSQKRGSSSSGRRHHGSSRSKGQSSAPSRRHPKTPTLPALKLAPITRYQNPLPDIGKPKIPEEDETVIYDATENIVHLPSTSGPKAQKSDTLLDHRSIVSQMNDRNMSKRIEATMKARKQLASIETPDIQSFLDAGILEPTIESLQIDNVTLQYEASWVITNLAAGTSEATKAVVDAGAIGILVRLMNSLDKQVQEQSLMALSNIAGESYFLQDCVVKAGILEPLLDLLRLEHPIRFDRLCAWTLTNLTRHKPMDHDPVYLDLILKAIKILLKNNDPDTQSDCLWTLSYVAEGPIEGAPMIVEYGFADNIVELLDHEYPEVSLPAVKTCAAIATEGDEEYNIESVLDAGALPAIKKILISGTSQLKAEAAIFISYLMIKDDNSPQRVIDEAILPLLAKAAKEESYKVRKESIQALSNLTVLGSEHQIRQVVAVGGLHIFLSEMDLSVDGQTVSVALEGVSNILKKCQDDEELEKVKTILLENRGVDILETHLGSEVVFVSRTASYILNKYFPDSRSVEYTDTLNVSQALTLGAPKGAQGIDSSFTMPEHYLCTTNEADEDTKKDSKVSDLAFKYMAKGSKNNGKKK